MRVPQWPARIEGPASKFGGRQLFGTCELGLRLRFLRPCWSIFYQTPRQAMRRLWPQQRATPGAAIFDGELWCLGAQLTKTPRHSPPKVKTRSPIK
jgi:hypothetical protein